MSEHPQSIGGSVQHPKINFRNPPFSFHRSLTRFCLPLSKFAKLPSNVNKKLIVGAAILRPTSTITPSPAETVNTSLEKQSCRILLVQRAGHESVYPNQWELPGGHAEFGIDQTLLEAVVREVREETGLKVTAVRKEFEGFEYGEEVKSKQYNFVVEVAMDKAGEAAEEESAAGLEVVLNPEEHQAFRWVDRHSLEGLEMTDDMRRCVEAALELGDAVVSRYLDLSRPSLIKEQP